jgi:hypothetical protein
MSAMFAAPEVATNTAVAEAAATERTSALLGHRNELAHARAIVGRLMAELEVITQQPELIHRVRKALDLSGEEPTIDQRLDMRGALSMSASLPMRAKIVKNLVDALHKLIGAEREAWGLNCDAGIGDHYTVCIRDYTGRGSAEAPPT